MAYDSGGIDENKATKATRELSLIAYSPNLDLIN
jgi:hypothetical protein